MELLKNNFKKYLSSLTFLSVFSEFLLGNNVIAKNKKKRKKLYTYPNMHEKRTFAYQPYAGVLIKQSGE